MAPKPQPRKPSISKTAAHTTPDPVKLEKDAKAMPPPPNPTPPGILVPQVAALSTTLKNVAVKTGQLYAFYADTSRLGIRHLAPAPPQSLTSALGREVEKYDELCDSIESKLLRAISVLQRDLAREERRVKEAEAAAEAKAQSVAGRTRSASRSPTTGRVPLPAIDVPMANGDSSPPSTADPSQSPSLSNSSILGRRPSAISISSLHRPNLPLKLDLSSSALRITPEEASLFSHGLASPVTLAPRSARPYGPNELPPDLIAALASADPTARRVDIDLTSPEHPPPDGAMTTIGNTADKPIELDLDAMEIDMAMSDLFSDAAAAAAESGSNADDAGLFTPVVPGPEIPHLQQIKTEAEADDDGFLSALSGTVAGAGDEDIFASLQAQDPHAAPPGATAPAPSPGSLLASFSQGDAGEGGAPAYDLEGLDLSMFGDGQNPDMNFDMQELLSIGGDEDLEVKMES